jgi:hypothetical protein
METLRKLINYLSSYWILILGFAVSYVFVRTGELPTLSYPDPEQFVPNYHILFTLYNYSTYIMVICFALNTIYVIRMLVKKDRIAEKSILFFIIVFSLWLLEIFVDPFGFNAWMFD